MAAIRESKPTTPEQLVRAVTALLDFDERNLAREPGGDLEIRAPVGNLALPTQARIRWCMIALPLRFLESIEAAAS